MTKVIDLSNNNGGVFPSADAYIFKITGGNGFVDGDFSAYVAKAKAAGKPWGVYHMGVDGYDSHDINGEINNFVGQLKKLSEKPSYLFLDYEGTALNTWSVDDVNAFLDGVKAAYGMTVGIYTSSSVVATKNWSGSSKTAKFWIASYGSFKPSIAGVTMVGWQYTSSPVDTSQWYETFGAGGGSGSTATPSNTRSTSSAGNNFWVDRLGWKWHKQVGKVVILSPDGCMLRWGASLNSTPIAALPAYNVVYYDAYSYHDGGVWVRQSRGNGEYGYMRTGTCDENGKTTDNWCEWR